MQSYDTTYEPMLASRLPPGLRTLLIVCGVVYPLQLLADHLTGGLFSYLFELRAEAVLRGQVWQLFSYIFLHGGVLHLLLNMLGLFFFGREMEQTLGTRRFLMLFFGCGALAGAGWMLITRTPDAHCVGASGAVFGIMGAFAAMFPYRRVTLLLFFVLPVTVTARMMALGLGLVTIWAMFSHDGEIAHSAHLAGGVAGYVYGRLRAAGRGWRPGIFRRSPRLRVLPEEEDAPSREDVDRILEKIREHGISSLTRGERDALERASRR